MSKQNIIKLSVYASRYRSKKKGAIVEYPTHNIHLPAHIGSFYKAGQEFVVTQKLDGTIILTPVQALAKQSI